MKPKKPAPDQDDLLRARLVEMIDMRHELVKLEALIDWDIFEREWLGLFPSHTGRPATPPRLVAGLCSLQHAFALVTRGRRGPLGGEPVLAAFLRGDMIIHAEMPLCQREQGDKMAAGQRCSGRTNEMIQSRFNVFDILSYAVTAILIGLVMVLGSS